MQEEPRNQGAWTVMLSKRHLGGCFPANLPLRCVARPYSASPAVGYHAVHVKQQQDVVEEALQLKRPTDQQPREQHKKSA